MKTVSCRAIRRVIATYMVRITLTTNSMRSPDGGRGHLLARRWVSMVTQARLFALLPTRTRACCVPLCYPNTVGEGMSTASWTRPLPADISASTGAAAHSSAKTVFDCNRPHVYRVDLLRLSSAVLCLARLASWLPGFLRKWLQRPEWALPSTLVVKERNFIGLIFILFFGGRGE